MGTRNLTMVISNGKTKVAQYGQWDGYPSGQGVIALDFLHNTPLDKFKEKLEACRFLTPEEVTAWGKAERWLPQFSRDHGAEILDLIMANEESEFILLDKGGFANNSLFCEFAYVIDLDRGTLEVYNGFNTEPLQPTDRFYTSSPDADGYYPVSLMHEFQLSNLPTDDEFLAILEPVEEE